MKPKTFLYLTILLAFIVRIWGINFGFPDFHFLLDENTMISKSVSFLTTGDWNPHWFGWPSLVMYLQAAVSSPVFYFMKTRMGAEGIGSNLAIFYLLSRLASGILGTATIYLIYKIGEKIYNRRIGQLAALIMAFSFPHVVYSHYATTDSTAVFIGTLSFIFCLKALEKGQLKDYILAGFFIGLANSAKYNPVYAIPLFIPLLLKHKRAEFKNLVLGLLAMILGFVMGTSYSILDFKTFASKEMGLMGLVYHIKDAENVIVSDKNGLSTPLWWGIYLFSSGLTPIVFLFASAGCIYLLIKKLNHKVILLLSFVIPYSYLMLKSPVRFDRYILSLTPFIALFVALLWNELLVFIGRINKLSKDLKLFAKVILLIVILALPVIKVVSFSYLISQKDTRLLAAEWLAKEYPKDQTVFAIGDTINIGHYLQKEGFNNVMNLFPFDTKEIFQYPGEILLIDSATYHVAENYKNTEKYERIWENYQLIKEKGELIKEFSSPLFKAGFFSPAFLEHSSTVNAYHNPTVEVYKIPKLDEYANSPVSFEYLPEKMDHSIQLVESDDVKYLFKDHRKEGMIFGPHALFPKGDYRLEYFIVKPQCHLKDALITIGVAFSGYGQYFAQSQLPCKDFVKYDRLSLEFRLKEPRRLEFILKADKGVSFLVEKALVSRTSYE